MKVMQTENINKHTYFSIIFVYVPRPCYPVEFKSLLNYSLLKVGEDFSDVGDLTSDNASDDDSRVLKINKSLKTH